MPHFFQDLQRLVSKIQLRILIKNSHNLKLQRIKLLKTVTMQHHEESLISSDSESDEGDFHNGEDMDIDRDEVDKVVCFVFLCDTFVYVCIY